MVVSDARFVSVSPDDSWKNPYRIENLGISLFHAGFAHQDACRVRRLLACCTAHLPQEALWRWEAAFALEALGPVLFRLRTFLGLLGGCDAAFLFR
jgi:hypothetical protein